MNRILFLVATFFMANLFSLNLDFSRSNVFDSTANELFLNNVKIPGDRHSYEASFEWDAFSNTLKLKKIEEEGSPTRPSPDPDGSIPMGYWLTQFDWSCNGLVASSYVFLKSNRTFTESKYTGNWSLQGNRYEHRYSSAPFSHYVGSYDHFNKKITGRMSNHSGQTGCFEMFFRREMKSAGLKNLSTEKLTAQGI